LKRVQKEGELFEHFLTDCKHLIRSCNYNEVDPDQTPKEKALRDKIVMGIKDPVTREALLRFEKLTFGKAIDLCRTSELSRHQNLQFQQNGDERQRDIHAVKKVNNKKLQREVSDRPKEKYEKFEKKM